MIQDGWTMCGSAEADRHRTSNCRAITVQIICRIRARMKIREAPWGALVLLMAIGNCGCDAPRGDDWTPKDNTNEYRYANHRFPEYAVVVHRVKGFNPGHEIRYFRESLTQIRGDFAATQPTATYFLVQVQDLSAHTSRETFSNSFRAARFFRCDEVLDHKTDLETLIRAQPGEQPPLEDDATHYGRYGHGGLLILRDIERRRLHVNGEGASHEPH